VCVWGWARFNANDLIMGFVRRAHVRDFAAAQLEKCKKSERERDAASRSKSESGPLPFTYMRARKGWKENYEHGKDFERETLKGSRRFSRRGPNCVSESWIKIRSEKRAYMGEKSKKNPACVERGWEEKL
jgi:hypothetical protein